MLAEGFPNMLMVLGPHTARGNIPQAIEHSVEWPGGPAAIHARAQLHPRGNPARARGGVDADRHQGGRAAAVLQGRFLADRRQPQRRGPHVRRVLGYNGNGANYRKTTDEVAKGGYQEFSFR